MNQIAAGEVVERPASIVKELVENAIDAESNRISLEISTNKNEITRIRITDDGVGIPAYEVPLAFVPHATSKIQSSDDLSRCLTLGFRGEALASIAAVAYVTMVTAPDGEEAGTRIIISGGEILEEITTGAPRGTSITVEEIFFNTPARKKFLKKLGTEVSKVAEVVETFAYLYPAITFRYLLNGVEKFSTHGTGTLEEILYALHPDETGDLIPIAGEEEGVRVSGFISRPSLTRQTPQRILISVNGRYVSSSRLTNAIRAGYHTLLPKNVYPVVVITLGLDPMFVDANVHPTKREVRFSNERRVLEFLRRSVYETLHATDLAPCLRGDEGDDSGSSVRVQASSPPVLPMQQEIGASDPMHSSPEVPAFQVYEPRLSVYRTTSRQLRQSRLIPTEEEEPAERFAPLTFVGQVGASYIVATNPTGDLVLVDQHAAHERIRYDQISAEIAAGASSQELLVPVLLSLSPAEGAVIAGIIPVLEEEGFVVEPFGKDTWAVRAVPVILGRSDDPSAVREIISAALSGDIRDVDLLKERISKLVACRGAVKAGAVLSTDQAEELLDQLGRARDPYTCPHGRPTIITFDQAHLAALFKRT